jgi:polyhydroxyalkanoate synthesis regulator phasin
MPYLMGMDEQLKRLLFMGLGLASTSRRAKFLLDKIEIEGKLSEEEGRRITDEILSALKSESGNVGNDIKDYLNDALSELETPSRKEFKLLQDRVQKLEAILRNLGHNV